MTEAPDNREYHWNDGDFQLTQSYLYSRFSEHPLKNVISTEVIEHGFKTKFRKDTGLMIIAAFASVPWVILLTESAFQVFQTRPWLSVFSLVAIAVAINQIVSIIIQLITKRRHPTMFTILFVEEEQSYPTIGSTNHDQIHSLCVQINKMIRGHTIEVPSRYPHLDQKKMRVVRQQDVSFERFT